MAHAAKELGLQVGLCAAERRARSRAGGRDRCLPGRHARPVGRPLPGLPPHRAVPRRPAPGRRPATLRGRFSGHQRSGTREARAGGRGAGVHNVILQGPPGSARRYSRGRCPRSFRASRRPRRSRSRGYTPSPESCPTDRHSSSSDLSARPTTRSATLVSSAAAVPQTGKVSLAHRGVLFLDELPEFGQRGLEVLRQPLEDGRSPSRAPREPSPSPPSSSWSEHEPLSLRLLPRLAPRLHLLTDGLTRYQKRLTGPLLDRIDIHVEVPRVEYEKLAVGSGRPRRRGRFGRASKRRGRGKRLGLPTRRMGKAPALTTNADMGPTQVRDHCPVDETGRQLLGAAMRQMNLSARAYHRVLKLARDDRGSGWERAHPAGASRGGDPVSAAQTRVTRALIHRRSETTNPMTRAGYWSESFRS